MALIPISKYNFKTTLASKDIYIELKKIINEERPLFKRMYANDEFSSKPYCGVISDRFFKASRVISYGNPVLPVVKGNFINLNDGINVKLSMRLSVFTQVALAIWFFVGFFMCIISFSFWPLIMVLLGYLFIIIPFNLEVKKDKKAIVECLK